MLDFICPPVYAVQPPSSQLMWTGLVTLLGYVVLSRAWRKVPARPEASMALPRPQGDLEDVVYPLCDYEVRFASRFGSSRRTGPTLVVRSDDAVSSATAV